jgi:hypothetical protein
VRGFRDLFVECGQRVKVGGANVQFAGGIGHWVSSSAK